MTMTAPPREPQNLYDALSTIYDWLCDDRLTQWPYMENGPFYSDLPKYQEVARAALAAAPAPSAEPRHLTTDEQAMLTRALRASAKRVDAPPAAQPAEPPAQAATDDLVRRLRSGFASREIEALARDAADLIEQQAREYAELRADKDAYHYERAERAEAERDVWKDKAETRGREGCEARADRDTLRADAERYWGIRAVEAAGMTHAEYDARVDAARAKVKP